MEPDRMEQDPPDVAGGEEEEVVGEGQAGEGGDQGRNPELDPVISILEQSDSIMAPDVLDTLRRFLVH